jgi:hypothetical protein
VTQKRKGLSRGSLAATKAGAKQIGAKTAVAKKPIAKRRRATPDANAAASSGSLRQPPGLPAGEVRALRELFWQNVLRELLSALVVASMKRHAPSQGSTSGSPSGSMSKEEEALLDGRVGLVTRRGERIPVASIIPVFAATAGRTPMQRAMSAAVEGTVFQIATPAGEVYTLPLHEVRGFHALSQELMQQLAGDEGPDANQHDTPFGFAAFTSLARTTLRKPVSDAPGATHEGAD